MQIVEVTTRYVIRAMSQLKLPGLCWNHLFKLILITIILFALVAEILGLSQVN